ncbi:MAG: hypothetical protein QM692_12310, partial [Thermomicrobiales bacterium]
PQAALEVALPLGDSGTRAIARWLAKVTITGSYLRSLIEAIAHRHARVEEIRSELARRETLGVGVR